MPVWVGMFLLLAACRDGYEGRAFVREADGGIGPTIRGVEMVFARENSAVRHTVRTDPQGRYRVYLPRARYRVGATHPAYEPYDSAPGFFVVTGNGLQTGNVFLTRRAATVVLLVRHAEKASGAANTDLDPDAGGAGVGLSRAAVLADVAADAGVEAVYSTDFCRTAQTAQPAAAVLGLPIQVMQTGNAAAGLGGCNPAVSVPTLPAAAATPAAIVQHVRAHHTGKVVLLVGHSNTVPALVEAFGAGSVCPGILPPTGGACVIPEDAYGHLFTVTVPTAGGMPTVVHATYGAP